jgi:hypothetical protein
MSEHVHLPDATFEHGRLHLAPPNGLQGGAYFAMMYYKDAPLYIQTPKCTSRQAVVPGKRPYIDLMFSSHDVPFLEWLEALEADAVRLIYEKRNLWFSGADLERSDIEAGFTSPVRPYKGGKNYLIRAHIQPAKHLAGTQSCSVFDENERPVSVDHIKAEHHMYTVLEFQGIKFTARSYQLEVALKQVLLVSNVPIFQSCIIRKPHASAKEPHENAIHENAIHENAIHENTITASSHQTESAPESEAAQEPPEQEQEQEQEHDTLHDNSANELEPEPGNSANELEPESEKSANELEPDPEPESVPHVMEEVNLDVLEELEHMHLKLKKPTEVYYNMYRNAKQKAKELKKNAIAAYLEAKQIKSAHMLEDSESESESDNDSDNNSEFSCN